MTELNVQRDLGRFEAEIGALKVSVDDLRHTVTNLTTVVAGLAMTVNEARGGWKMMMLLGGMASVLGALLQKFSEHVTKVFQ